MRSLRDYLPVWLNIRLMPYYDRHATQASNNVWKLCVTKLHCAYNVPWSRREIMSKCVVGSKFDGFLRRNQQNIYGGSFIHSKVALRFISLFETIKPGMVTLFAFRLSYDFFFLFFIILFFSLLLLLKERHNAIYIDLYIRSPFGPITWFCNLVLTKSSGNTTDTPIIPAMPPFIIFGTSL